MFLLQPRKMDGKRSEETNSDNLYTNIGDANDTYMVMSRNLDYNNDGEYLQVDYAKNLVKSTTENLDIAAGKCDTTDQDIDKSRPSYVPMNLSHDDDDDDDYLEVIDAQNIAFTTTENLESAAKQKETKIKKLWSVTTSPAIIKSNPSTNFESQPESRGTVRMTSSNPNRHIYTTANPPKEEKLSCVSNEESQHIYSYAAPDFGGQFPKAATLNIPPSGKSPSPSKSKPYTSLKERGDFDGKHNGTRAIALQLESKIFQRRAKEGVSRPATEKKFATVQETARRVDTHRINCNENENSVANSKKKLSPKDDCADYTEVFEKLKGSFERENDISPSTSQMHLLESPKSSSSSPRKRRSLSYEMKELANGKPSRKEDIFKKKITQSRRFRIHLGLLICMLLASITILTFQILGISGEFSEKNEQMNQLLILTQRVKNMDDKMNSSTKDINFLKRKLEYQKTMIRNLQNVLQIYNMTNNLTMMDANTRVRRSKIRISNIDNEFLRLTKKDQELKFMAHKMKAQLKEKVDEMKMTPGRKGRRSEHGFYSFTRCRRSVKTSSRYAHHGSLDSFTVNVGIMLDTKGERVMSIACSSQEASGSFYTRIPYAYRRFYHECTCMKAKQAGYVRCHIIYYVCPRVE